MSKNHPHPTKAVLFDLGKVLLFFNFDQAFHRLSKMTGVSVKTIEDFFIASGIEVLYDGGKISSKIFYEETKKGLGIRISFLRFKGIWNGIFTPNKPMIKLARRLSKTHRLVLISNTNEMHFQYIRQRYAFLKYFDGIVLSYKERIRKPDERIYRLAARACKAKPADIFYIDDRPDFTGAAAELDFQVFTYRGNHAELLHMLKNRGIL